MPAPLRFAHFEVLTRSDGSPYLLGHGAMGATFKALDQNLLSLAVVKVPSVELLGNPAARQRFLQEAQMMARLRHPHVASVFYYGDTASGPFYAMEFCDGPSLHDYIYQHGPLEPEDALRLALQTASALKALDAHELVHRDLKPSNILLTTDSGGGAHVKLIDFGVAKEGMPTDTGGLTLGGFIGTPAFASPEQLLEASHLDSRSDLYSLGAVMWFCLTGQPPFQGSQFEVMFHHVNTEPLWSELPPMNGASVGVMKRLLAKSAEERYSSPAALIEVLQKILGIATPVSNSMLLRTSIYEKDKAGLSGFETLQSLAADDFGKVYKACDVLTGKIVSMREFPAEFAQKQGLILRMQRLAAILRPLDHPRWQRIWHFEHSGAECRLATELIEGPTLLQLLKVHQHLGLSYALPLLMQLVEAMDAAASEGLTAVETAIERLPVAVEGWGAMGEQEQSALLRKPFSEWPAWSVKVCTLRLSNAIQDYALPSDSQAALALTRISNDFVQLCYRLLTGQGRSGSAYVPSPLLSAESNVFFEKHFSTQRASSPQTCDTLLRHLCRAEGVAPPELPEDQKWDPFATRVVTRQRTVGKTRGQTMRSHSQQATSAPDAPTVITRTPVSSSSFDTPTLLEERHAKVTAEAGGLKAEGRLRAEQEWIAREREAIERAKKEVAKQELVRAQQLADEQSRLAEQKKQIERQQALLEEKRREQERLEQEIQLRAQLEFQKVQEEALAKESDLQRQRQAVEQALKEREREFEERERARLKELHAIKTEADQLEEAVENEYLTVRHFEDEQVRYFDEATAIEAEQLEQLAASEAKLAELEARSSRHIEPLPSVQAAPAIAPESLHKPASVAPQVKKAKSNVAVLLGVCFLGFAVFLGGCYFIYNRFSGSKLHPFLHSFTESGESRMRLQLKEEQRWYDLLRMCLQQEPALRQTQAKGDEISALHADAVMAVNALLADQSTWPEVSDPKREEWIAVAGDLVKWQGISIPESALLVAKLRVPLAVHHGDTERAMDDYLAALKVNPEFYSRLESEAALIARQLDAVLGQSFNTSYKAWLLQLEDVTFGKQLNTPGIAILVSLLRVADFIHEGDPGKALATLIELEKSDGSGMSYCTRLTAVLTRELAVLEHDALLALKPLLVELAEKMNLADAWFLLAKVESDAENKNALLVKADGLGSLSARGVLGKEVFDDGVRRRDAEAINAGLKKLREAAGSGRFEDQLLLADALATEMGGSEPADQAVANAQEALEIAEQAVENHPGPAATYVAGKASLRLGYLEQDADAYLRAIKYLNECISSGEAKAGVYYLLYKANNNAVIRTRQKQAAEALQKGSELMDADCLYELGLWYQLGRPPLKADPARSHDLIEKAAKLGHESAMNWLKQRPAAPQF